MTSGLTAVSSFQQTLSQDSRSFFSILPKFGTCALFTHPHLLAYSAIALSFFKRTPDSEMVTLGHMQPTLPWDLDHLVLEEKKAV